jgi:arsenate reductase-like glutaredoxin family protein
MTKQKELQEAVEFFDKFVNAALSKDTDKYKPLDVVKNYNVVKNELAKLLVSQE